MKEGKEVLWLASWYPNRVAPYDGDFIQRHAQAASMLHPVYVIFVKKDADGRFSGRCEIVTDVKPNLTEEIAYYRPLTTGIRLVDRFISLITYLRLYRNIINKYLAKRGKPVLVNVQVTLWAGALAYWLKRKYRIPYLISEHWTGFSETAHDNIYDRGMTFRSVAKQVIRNAALTLPVCQYLGKCMQRFAGDIPFISIKNVVDTELFFASPRLKSSVFTFIHVSSMHYQKNVDGILRVFSRMRDSPLEWKLVMVGPAPENLQALAGGLGLDHRIEWKGEISFSSVAAEMRKADALVMFSRYENLPCVIAEALCCGLPVVSSRVAGIPEMLDDTNAIMVDPENEVQLQSALLQMLTENKWSRESIAGAAKEIYNFQKIAREISAAYKQVDPSINS